MDSDSAVNLPSKNVFKCCDCECDCHSLAISSSYLWNRTVKRKYGEFNEGNGLVSTDLCSYSKGKILSSIGLTAVPETHCRQRKIVENLYAELEEERNAASSAAKETMSMILRLQREKAEIQMEARQFKAFAEEKMEHDQQKLAALEDLLYEKDQAIMALTYEFEAYKKRMLINELTKEDMEGDPQYIDSGPLNYFLFPESPTGQEAVCQLERDSGYNRSEYDFNREDVVEKVIIGQSPRWLRHGHKLSMDSIGSREAKEIHSVDSPMSTSSFKRTETMNDKDSAYEVRDDICDRVCTIDSVSEICGVRNPKMNGGRYFGDFPYSPRQQESNEGDVEKLYTRIQALEAERESLRHVINSTRTDKTQLELLEEIAQRLSKEMGSTRQMGARKIPFLGALSVMTLFKWITSVVSWKKKYKQKEYVYGMPANNMALLMSLDEGCRTRRWRCLTSTHT